MGTIRLCGHPEEDYRTAEGCSIARTRTGLRKRRGREAGLAVLRGPSAARPWSFPPTRRANRPRDAIEGLLGRPEARTASCSQPERRAGERPTTPKTNQRKYPVMAEIPRGRIRKPLNLKEDSGR